MSVNKVILVGNVGKDPEVRYLESGACVAQFTMATNEVYTNKNGEKVKQTEWHNIVLWNKRAQVAENYVRKGSQIYIEGKLRTRHYEDKDGVTRYRTEVFGDNMQLLDRKDDHTTAPPPQQFGSDTQAAPVASSSTSTIPGTTQATPPVQEPMPQSSPASSIDPEDDDDLPF